MTESQFRGLLDDLRDKDRTIAELREQVAAEHAKYIKAEQAATVAIQAQTIIKLHNRALDAEAKLAEAEKQRDEARAEIASLRTVLSSAPGGFDLRNSSLGEHLLGVYQEQRAEIERLSKITRIGGD